jgi:PIN domain nuclease of toxin-antitoxin system
MIVLDTHAWVWFLSNPELLSKKAKRYVDAAVKENAIMISSISVWEVALLVARKRLILTLELSDWIAKAEMLPFFKFIPVDNSV